MVFVSLDYGFVMFQDYFSLEALQDEYDKNFAIYLELMWSNLLEETEREFKKQWAGAEESLKKLMYESIERMVASFNNTYSNFTKKSGHFT